MKHIKTEKEYLLTLDEIDILMNEDPAPNKLKGNKLDELCDAADRYEETMYENHPNKECKKYD